MIARAAAPAARRTATWSMSALRPSPTNTTSGEAIVPLEGTLVTSPALPFAPRLASSGRSLRPYAAATSSPPGATSTVERDWTSPTTTASARVLAGLAPRKV